MGKSQKTTKTIACPRCGGGKIIQPTGTEDLFTCSKCGGHGRVPAPLDLDIMNAPVDAVRVFIFEDDPDRIQAFRDRFNSDDIPPGITIVWAATDDVEEAKNLLATVEFDLVFLDHDLVIIQEPKPGKLVSAAIRRSETGYDVAHWLAMNPKTAAQHGAFYVHSLNARGQELIAGALRSTGTRCTVAPYLWTETIFEKHIKFPLKNKMTCALEDLGAELEALTDKFAHLKTNGDYDLTQKLRPIGDGLRDLHHSMGYVIGYSREKNGEGHTRPPTPHCNTCGCNPSIKPSKGCEDSQGCGYWRGFLKWHKECEAPREQSLKEQQE